MKTIDLSILSATQKIAAKRAIQTALRIGVIEIQFVKENGETRTMIATLSPQVLEKFNIQLELAPENENFENIILVDFNAKALRSFKIERLVHIGLISARDLIAPITSSL